MIKIVMGLKGTGKTKTLIEAVNNAAEVEHGNVVCIEKGDKLKFDISHKVRLVNSDEFDIKDFDTPLINIKYDKKKLKIVSKYINIYDNKNEPKNHVAYKLIDLCKFELYEIFDFLIKHK